MLICKGQNIFPTDIEHVLLQHSSIARAAAVGVPDVMRGEVVGAAIVLHKDVNIDETSLQKYCLERMANYKTPKYFAFMESLPVKENGVIDKQRIREYFIAHPKNQSSSC
jgi:fatty-acyl-CoA synthase